MTQDTKAELIPSPGAGSFGQYGKQFQEKILQGLLTDSIWASTMVEVMSSDYFDLRYLQFLSDKYFDHYKKYKTFPTLSLLITIVKDEIKTANDKVLGDQIVEFIQRMKFNPDVGDLPYVKDKSLEFCRRQALRQALEKSVDLIDSEKYETVLEVVKQAVSVGIPTSTGHDFFEDIEARFVKNDRKCVPTGIPKLDAKEILNGGLGRGELLTVTAATGGGKSHFLVALGANALRQGKNVIHYTFELTEIATGLRYDSNLCSVPSNEVQDHKERVTEAYKNEELGRLIIKEYPPNFATVNTIRSHIEKLMLKGFTPNLIIIDYADIMRSTAHHDTLRHELKLIYEELRALGMSFNLPVATASQSNREGSTSDIVDLNNMSEAYGKAMVADIVLTLSRKSKEKATGFGRLFVAKNRAGRDGIVFPMKMDTAMSKIELLEDNMTLEEAQQDDQKRMRELLRTKLKEINGE